MGSGSRGWVGGGRGGRVEVGIRLGSRFGMGGRVRGCVGGLGRGSVGIGVCAGCGFAGSSICLVEVLLCFGELLGHELLSLQEGFLHVSVGACCPATPGRLPWGCSGCSGREGAAAAARALVLAGTRSGGHALEQMQRARSRRGERGGAGVERAQKMRRTCAERVRSGSCAERVRSACGACADLYLHRGLVLDDRFRVLAHHAGRGQPLVSACLCGTFVLLLRLELPSAGPLRGCLVRVWVRMGLGVGLRLGL